MSRDEKSFGEYSHYYDLLYRDKDYTAEVNYITRLLERFSIVGGRLLEFGAGTGKHGALLVEEGFEVSGIELSEEMVSQAPNVDGLNMICGDIANTSAEGRYDAVLSLFHVMSYQITNNQLIKVFQNAARHLDPGGLFIFDFWYSPAVYTERPSPRLKTVCDRNNHLTRLADPVVFDEENRVAVNYTIFCENTVDSSLKIIRETHELRHFSLPELDLLAASTGFERKLAEEFVTGRSPNKSTWGVCVVFERVEI